MIYQVCGSSPLSIQNTVFSLEYDLSAPEVTQVLRVYKLFLDDLIKVLDLKVEVGLNSGVFIAL